jgi:ZIP family zinc transporter
MILSESISGDKIREEHGETKSNIRNTGMAVALGIAIHNFLEGIAEGSGYKAEHTLGISLAVAILLHDVPEGMSVAIPLRAGGMKRFKAFIYALASGLPMGLGSMFGVWAGTGGLVYCPQPCRSRRGNAVHSVCGNASAVKTHERRQIYVDWLYRGNDHRNCRIR